MGIFIKSRSELQEEVVRLNNLVTELRDDKISTQIDLSRANSGFNAQQESDRANNQIAKAQLLRRIEELEADSEDRVEACVNTRVTILNREALADRLAARKELRAEFGTELDTLKKSNASLITASAANKGLYEGALLVIKALETQLKSTNELNANLLKNLPTVSAEITTPSVTVGSNNKVS